MISPYPKNLEELLLETNHDYLNDIIGMSITLIAIPSFLVFLGLRILKMFAPLCYRPAFGVPSWALSMFLWYEHYRLDLGVRIAGTSAEILMILETIAMMVLCFMKSDLGSEITYAVLLFTQLLQIVSYVFLGIEYQKYYL